MSWRGMSYTHTLEDWYFWHVSKWDIHLAWISEDTFMTNIRCENSILWVARYRKRSLGLEQCARLSLLGERVTPDVDFMWQLLWVERIRFRDITVSLRSTVYLTRNINLSFYAEAASAFLLRPTVSFDRKSPASEKSSFIVGRLSGRGNSRRRRRTAPTSSVRRKRATGK